MPGSCESWGLDRCSNSWCVASPIARVDEVIVLVGDDDDGRLARELVPPDVAVFTSAGRDALSRFCDVLDHFRPDGAVRVLARKTRSSIRC